MNEKPKRKFLSKIKIRGWFKTNWNGILVGFLVGFLVSLTLKGPTYVYDLCTIELREPKPEIEIREVNDSVLIVDFLQLDNDESKINDLYFKFDIPGRLVEYDISNLNLVDYVNIDNDKLCAHAGIVTAETIRIHLKNIRPGGYTAIKLKYISTYDDQTSDLIFKPGFLDLHTISKVICVWEYKSTEKLNNFYHDFTNLKYIQDDMNRLLSVPWYENLSDIEQMNYERRDW